MKVGVGQVKVGVRQVKVGVGQVVGWYVGWLVKTKPQYGSNSKEN